MSGTATLVIPAEVAERMAAKQPRCGNCRYMRFDANRQDRECHIGPPTPAPLLVPTQPPKMPGMEVKIFCSFPIVTEAFWCAKHEPKPE
jgi:hypothetical protein